MAARGLLRHPVDARVHHHITNPYHTMRSRHFEFASTRLSPIFTRRRLLSSVSFQAITCMRLKDQGDCETEVALKHQAEKDLISSGEPDLTEFVNKAPPGPMVEVDPKTTFRRFIAERGASLALGLQAGQTATPQCLPFPTYRKWTPNFAFATILPAFFLAFLVAFYLLRPRKDTQKQIESLRGEGKSETDVSININGRKLVKEILKVPESVRTAMKLGADSVNRVKVYNESSHNNINGTKSNFVDATVLANSANSKPTMISLANENVESEGSDNREPGGTPAFGNMADATVPVNLANSQPAIKSSTSGNVELEEIEAPGFCQPFNDPSYEEKSSFTKAQMTGTDGSVAHVEDSALNMDTDGIVHSKSVMKDTECYDTPFQNSGSEKISRPSKPEVLTFFKPHEKGYQGIFSIRFLASQSFTFATTCSEVQKFELAVNDLEMEIDIGIYDELAIYSSSSSSSSEETDEKDIVYEPSSSEETDEEDTAYQPYLKREKEPQVKGSFTDSFPDLLEDDEDGKRVTVEQCKVFLRKHGLRLSGTKAMLVERIKEYLRVQRTTEDSKLEVSNHAVDSVDNDLVESISTLSLNHTSSMATITELLKDEKKLKIEDCKAYMRKHGLRLAGTKQVLIDRIKEHVRIMDDQGMVLYPESTFIINCQGDACVGDVVLFKQRVYDLFNLGGRCSVGPAVGVRSVAGRIVNESYGSAKQQHTFTIEVLWSKGDRPLPPLYPLIIKGRNLYRIKTLRQAWADESERKRKLEEKHARGAQARMERRARISGNKIDNIRPMMCNANNVPGWQEKDVVSSIVLRFKSVLAGLIVGKHLKNLNELRAVSHAQVDVDRDPEDPAHCVVKITGTEHQRQVAISMLNAKTLCRFFANKGNCSNGEQCSFRHHSL